MKSAAICGGMLLALPMAASAQNKVETEVGANIVSSYIWRGQDLSGVSIQPSIAIGYKGLSLEAWGSIGFDKEDCK